MTSPELPSAADLARYNLAAQHPHTLAWSSEGRRLANLAEEHAFDVQLATDLDLAQQRADTLRAGPPAEAYLNRWVRVSADLAAMLSIRFEGGNVTLPFVDVSVTTRPVVRADLPALLDSAGVFGDFHAPRLRFWSAAPPDAHPQLNPDQRVLTAPLADLRNGAVTSGLTLRLTTDESHYLQAQAAYDAVDADHAEHLQQARLLSTEDLRESIDAGTMFDVIWHGEWSGYAGTLAHSQLGLDAQVIQEMLLTPHARGQGLGASVSVLLARRLAADGRVLSGTIHGRNRGAVNAARQAGRHDVGGWWWVPLG